MEARNILEGIKREGSFSFLMIPASNIEKFVSRVLFVTVFYILVSSVAFLLADVTQYVLYVMLEYFFNLIMGKEFATQPTFFTWEIVEMWPLITANASFVTGLLLLLLVQSLAAMFSKRIWVLGAILVFWRFIPDLLLKFVHTTSAIYVSANKLNVVICILTVFCWWMAYRPFSRRQIV